MYKLDNLPYSYDALEPFIDTHTLGLHYNKHQKNYLKNLNDLLLKNHYSYDYSIEELPNYIMNFNIEDREDILFNLGGVLNHTIYFNSMSPKKEEPNLFFRAKILNTYGSYEEFKNQFKRKALSLKGSGYTFLVLDQNELKIVNLKNQDTPYYYHLIPLIGLDMWEHSYYINYENQKTDYIDNFFNIVDFSKANKFFSK